jgi:hypothetical protein
MKPQKYIVTVDKCKWDIEWRNEAGELHRLDGPAINREGGHKQWWVDGKRHRLGGPAVEYSTGTKEWYVNGKRHRLDGPAIEWWDGDKAWWIEGKRYTEEQFNKKVKQLQNKSCEGKIVEIEGKKYKLTSV